MNGRLFVQRPGGVTYRASPLNAVFLDLHESWYALHWTTPFDVFNLVDYCQKDLELPRETGTIIQSSKEGTMRMALADIKRRSADFIDGIEFLRLDALDYALVWEQSGEWHRLIDAGQFHRFTAILGFGTDRVDRQFTYKLFSPTATDEIRHVADTMWSELKFLPELFKQGTINPSRSYKND